VSVRFKRGEELIAVGPQIGCPECLPGRKPRRKPRFLAIDMFAGAGGFTTGAEGAGGLVAWAINHSVNAISAHILNHPHTTHCCESIYNYDPGSMVDALEARTGRRVPDVFLASPSCKVTSRARSRGKGAGGSRAMTTEDDKLRATPAAVHSFMWKILAEADKYGERLPIVVVENVAEFSTWGRKPKGAKKPNGVHYRQWKRWWEPDTGYHEGVEHVLQAADFGVAAERRRMFVIFTPQDRYPKPIRLDTSWIEPVLGKTKAGKARPTFDWRYSPAVPVENQLGNFLVRDFSKGRVDPGGVWKRSLGRGSKQSALWKAKFEVQLAKAKKRNGGKAPTYWSWSYTDDTAPRFLQDPQRTLTSKMGGQLYVMHSSGGVHHHRTAHPEELGRWMGLPPGYVLPEASTEAGRLVGNAVVPAVAQWILEELIRTGAL
jgi:DNA (cytosine-5)-methyltransferase 1